MNIYYIVTYTRSSGIGRQTVGIECDHTEIEVQAHLNRPIDPAWAKRICNDPWIVAEIEPVDAPGD